MTIATQLNLIRQRIEMAELSHGRSRGSVNLLAVSKGQSIAKIKAALAAGQHAFGENYLQEALLKMNALSGLAIEWHFIGHIQTNKTAAIAANFQWVHSIDRLKVATRLNQQRLMDLPPLNVCIEVNVSGEQKKSGVKLQELPELIAAVAELPRLKLRGLMTIPAPQEDLVLQRKPYRLLREAMVVLQQQGFALDTLSMGMSNDFEAAIAEGSTWVRVGTLIFGTR